MTKDYKQASEELIITSKDNNILDVNEILDDYEYIKDAIEDEDYIIEFPFANYFEEIIIDNKVVGFLTMLVFEENNKKLLNNIYIIPEYRGNKILYNVLKKYIKEDCKFFLYHPNHKIIDILLHYNLAIQSNGNIVLTSIPIMIDITFSIQNVDDGSNIKNYITSVYDTYISAALYRSLVDDKIVVSYYSMQHDSDDVYYRADKNRRNINEEYFENIVQELEENETKYQELLIEMIEEDTDEEYIINELVNNPAALESLYKILMEEGLISPEDIRNIKRQVEFELKEGIITKDTMATRIIFLANTKDLNLSLIRQMTKKDRNACPYCGNKIEDNNESCNMCGYTLSYKYLDEYLDEIEDEKNHEDDNMDYEDDEWDNEIEYEYRLDKSLGDMDEFDLRFYNVIEEMQYDSDLADQISFTADLEEINPIKLLKRVEESGYVSKYIIREYWNETCKDLKRKDLEYILNRYDQKVSGTEEELIKRIEDNIPLEEIEFNSLPSYANYDHTIYLLTPAGHEYLEENKQYDLYDRKLYSYHFNDYMNYLAKYPDSDLYQTTIKYLKEHEKEAVKKNSDFTYVEHIRVQAEIYKEIGKKEYFQALVRLFFTELNPLKVPDNLFFTDELINEDTIKKIKELIDEEDYSLKAELKKLYNNTKYQKTIPQKVVIKNIPRLLALDDLDELEEEWKDKYFKKMF